MPTFEEFASGKAITTTTLIMERRMIGFVQFDDIGRRLVRVEAEGAKARTILCEHDSDLRNQYLLLAA